MVRSAECAPTLGKGTAERDEEAPQDLQPDVTTELRVFRAVDLAHATATGWREDVVRTDAGPSRERHRYFVVGTRRFSSSNQFSTTTKCERATDVVSVPGPG